MTVGRLLVCSSCRRDWDVIELPVEFLDPQTYVCGECLQPVEGQLDMEAGRVEERTYDPAVAAWPEGF